MESFPGLVESNEKLQLAKNEALRQLEFIFSGEILTSNATSVENDTSPATVSQLVQVPSHESLQVPRLCPSTGSAPFIGPVIPTPSPTPTKPDDSNSPSNTTTPATDAEEDLDEAEAPTGSRLSVTSTPELFLRCEREFQPTDKVEDNFIKGCRWSPDGTCLLTASEDRILRLFDFSKDLNGLRYEIEENEEEEKREKERDATLRIRASDLVYDYDWYPFMNSTDSTTCCFVVSARHSPVHLYDAYDGSLRCSYLAFNQVEEFVSAVSVAFSPDGAKLLCGYNKTVRVFDLATPGRDCELLPTYEKRNRRGLKGIVSCFAFHPTSTDLVACGSYSRSIGLFSLRSGEFQHRLDGHRGGVTGLRFSPCGTRLFSVARKDDEILCFDVRNLGQILFSAKREMTTNQRVQFDVDDEGRFLFSGDTAGNVTVWDLASYEKASFCDDGSLAPLKRFRAHREAVSGTSLHPHLPLLATTSGQRHFLFLDEGDSSNEEDDDPVWRRLPSSSFENSLKIWRIK